MVCTIQHEGVCKTKSSLDQQVLQCLLKAYLNPHGAHNKIGHSGRTKSRQKSHREQEGCNAAQVAQFIIRDRAVAVHHVGRQQALRGADAGRAGQQQVARVQGPPDVCVACVHLQMRAVSAHRARAVKRWLVYLLWQPRASS